MKQLDYFKLKAMLDEGKSADEIIKVFHQYPEEEIRKFLPSDKPKKRASKKKAVKKEGPTSATDFLD